jgi:predicted phosphodiesterase
MGQTTVVPTPKEPQMWFIAGDWHYDQLSPACFEILIKHALSVPEKHRNLIINGDFLDLALFMPKNSDFQIWCNRKDGIEMFFLPEYEKEIKWGNDTLDALQSVFKKIIFVFGNHDKPRVDFFVNNHCQEAYKPHFNLVANLNLVKRNIGWVEYNDWLDIGNLTVTHGMSHGSTCIKKHYELSGGRNVVFSHVHTAECKTFASRGVTRAVWSLPSMANLNPHYIKNSDVSWQNGYGTFTMKPNGNFNMNIHLVIDNELCLPNGEIIKG